jgi:hypothetical protein
MSASNAKAIEPSSKPGNVDGEAGATDARGGGGGGSQLALGAGAAAAGAGAGAGGAGAGAAMRDAEEGGAGGTAALIDRELGSAGLARCAAGIAGLDGGFATAGAAAASGRTAVMRVESIRIAPFWFGSAETE